MDALMLVEVLDVHGHVQIRQRVRGSGGQCRIGRSLHCDVVLDDPYVAPEHVLLTLQEDGRVLVQDLGTRNGTRVDGRPVDAAGQMVANGELQIGRTAVRLRSQDGPLPPERVFRRDLLRRHRTALAAAGTLSCLSFAVFLQWLAAPETLGQRMLIAALATLAGLAVWVSAWSLVSRLTVGAWQVRIHLAIATFCVGLWVWGYWLYGQAAYALQWRWLGPWLFGAALVALAAAYLHLRNATHLPRLASLTLAVLAPVVVGGVAWLVDQQIDPRTVNRVEPGPGVYPGTARVAPSMDLGDYLSDAASLKRDANRNRQQSLLQTPVLDAED